MRILIVHATTEGQTRKIAGVMADHFTIDGHAVTMADATNAPPGPSDFDLVILGGSVHAGRHQMALAHYAKVNAVMLNSTRSAFFSVSLSAAGHDAEAKAEVEQLAQRFGEEAGWLPERVECIAGALKYTQYDFFKRFIMRLISGRSGGSTDTSQDHEYTDWAQVQRFCKELVAVKREAQPKREAITSTSTAEPVIK